MEFEQSAQNNVIILKLTGDITLYDAGEIEERVNRIMAEGISRIVLDLSNVPYIDSMGIGVMITLKTRIKKMHGDLKLANTRENVKKVFIMTRLDKTFDFRNSTEEAVTAFGG